MNCVFMIFILGGFGMYMRLSVFWVCWSFIVIEVIMFNIILLSIDYVLLGNSIFSV